MDTPPSQQCVFCPEKSQRAELLGGLPRSGIDKKAVKWHLKFRRKISGRPVLGYKPTAQLFLASTATACCFPRWL